jgi:hypothetical protein
MKEEVENMAATLKHSLISSFHRPYFQTFASTLTEEYNFLGIVRATQLFHLPEDETLTS